MGNSNRPPSVPSCPTGSVGLGDSRYEGKGVRLIFARSIYTKTASPSSTTYPETVSISGCKAKCDSYGSSCKSFTYQSRSTFRRCTLYSQTGPTSYDFLSAGIYNVRSCAQLPQTGTAAAAVAEPEVYRCPPGTSQIGAVGKYGKPSSGVLQEITDDLQNIDECEKRCCDHPNGCLAFIFDDDPDICILLASNSDAVVTDYAASDDLGNSVLCALDDDGAECEAEGDCPAGSEQIGETGDRYRGQLVGSFSYKTVGECAEQCKCNEDCFVFTFDDNVNGRSICKLYQLGTMTTNRWLSTSEYAQEITCAIEVCPDGSSQIGGVGTGISESDLITAERGIGGVESCMEKCQGTNGCVAFTFDHDIRTYTSPRDKDGGSNTKDKSSDNGCWLYSSSQPGTIPRQRYTRDGVSCGLDTVGSSAQSGYYNFEAITNEAGQGSSDMSVYIIYGVMVLILVNIICLVINCWNKKRGPGNGRRYKVVSMRSDEEITDA